MKRDNPGVPKWIVKSEAKGLHIAKANILGGHVFAESEFLGAEGDFMQFKYGLWTRETRSVQKGYVWMHKDAVVPVKLLEVRAVQDDRSGKVREEAIAFLGDDGGYGYVAPARHPEETGTRPEVVYSGGPEKIGKSIMALEQWYLKVADFMKQREARSYQRLPKGSAIVGISGPREVAGARAGRRFYKVSVHNEVHWVPEESAAPVDKSSAPWCCCVTPSRSKSAGKVAQWQLAETCGPEPKHCYTPAYPSGLWSVEVTSCQKMSDQ